tara:strand:+ start:276 stop:431 length:156 start_codon:yes stop_codon:yes gene_type:complete
MKTNEDYKKAIAWLIVLIIGLPVLIIILIKAAFVIPLIALFLSIYYLATRG